MKELELKSIVKDEISQALGHFSSEISSERSDAMDAYLGQPYGNEVDGRSQVVTSDTMDVIEAILPQLIRIFTSTDKAVIFEPVGPDDEKAAKQETEVTNHVFYKMNKGFLILYTQMKDALLQKTGFVRTYFEKYKKSTREEYENLTDQQFNMLLSDEDLEPIEHTEKADILTDVQTGQPIPLTLHDVVFKRTSKRGRACVINIPPEEVLVSRRTTSPDLKTAPFICHRTKKTASELVEMGYKKSLVEKLPNYEKNQTEEHLSRNFLADEQPDGSDSKDPAMREIMIEDCYLYVDYDDDGIAELRHVMLAGDEVLENEEVDSHGFSSITPIILTHKFYGLSIHDIMGDLQKINTTILRQILDNMYLTNNTRMAAQEGRVNLDDLLSSRPGGVIRTSDPPSSALMQIVQTPLLSSGLEFLNYTHSLIERRTGVGDTFQGLNADLLKDANIPVAQGIYSAIHARVELIARIFAEGIKQMFLDLHEVLQKHQDQPLVIKLRSQWIEVNPKDWKDRTDMSVTVGLGSGSRAQELVNLEGIKNDLAALAQTPYADMVSATNIYNLARKKIEAAGYNPDEFVTDPSLLPPQQPPPPDPTIELLKMQMQVEAEKNQVALMKNDLENQRKLLELQQEQEKVLLQERTKLTELELKYNKDIPGSSV